MDALKKLFPFSFGTKDVGALIVRIIVYLVAGVIIGVLCWIIGWIPLVGGIIAWIIRSVCGIYLLAGIIILILDYCKVLQ